MRRVAHRVLLWLVFGPLCGSGAGCAGSEDVPSIILVSLDTLRADRLGVYGNPDGLTPHLDAFSETAVTFETVFAQSNVTSLSHASLFTSRYPSELGAIGTSFHPSPERPMLAEVLATYGYETGAVVGGGHLASEYELDRGFEDYLSPMDWGSLFHTVPVGLDWLDERDSDDPFFLFLHSYDLHTRYLKPTPYGLSRMEARPSDAAFEAVRSLYGTRMIFDGLLFGGDTLSMLTAWCKRPRVWDVRARMEMALQRSNPDYEVQALASQDLEFIRDVYDGAASYADLFMGIFFEELDRRGLLDEAVIVITSDHGEGLGEQGIFEHGFHMSDEVLRVPLMIRLPDGRNGGHRVQAPVALLDVMPTLLEMGQARPPAGIHGGTLSTYLDGGDGTGRPVVYSEGYIRSISAWSSVGRLTFTGVGADSQFLGDLLQASPLESIAFSTSTARSPEVLEALRQETLTWRRSLSPRPRTGNENTSVIESMQKRGYWGSP